MAALLRGRSHGNASGDTHRHAAAVVALSGDSQTAPRLACRSGGTPVQRTNGPAGGHRRAATGGGPNKSLMERYESLGPVGEGSYGTVIKCRHRDSGRLVAIKKFMDLDDDKTVKKIAQREIKLLKQLRHDNLVNLLEVWKRRRRWYLVFELVDRTLLDDLEQSAGGLAPDACRRCLFQILRAVDFCHQQNVIHRDIKPENILVSQEGVVKLCDFGFARTLASHPEGSVYTDYVATRWYRAPELLVGDTKYGKPVDIWALGCVFLEMLTGQPLFPGDSDLDQLYRIVRCFGTLMTHHQELFYRNPVFSGVKLPECLTRVSLRQRFSTVPADALDLAQRCFEMDPKRRSQCSALLEHPFFTHDSFHIRFLDELNGKIQKEHRENSTLPKIAKTASSCIAKGDEKRQRSKDRKPDEEKPDTSKRKQAPKQAKTVCSTAESFVSKKNKAFGNKGVLHTPQLSTKHRSGEPADETQTSKATKGFPSEAAESTGSTLSLKHKNVLESKAKHEQEVTPEPRKDQLSVNDVIFRHPVADSNLLKITGLSKSETCKEFGKGFGKSHSKAPKGSKNPDGESTLESDTGLLVTSVSAATVHDTATSHKTFPKFPTDRLNAEQEPKTSESPKIPPKIPKTSKTTSSIGQSKKNTVSSTPKTLVDLYKQPLVGSDASPAHTNTSPPKGPSNSKISPSNFITKTLPKDQERANNAKWYFKKNPVTDADMKSDLLSCSLWKDETSQSSSGGPNSSKIVIEEELSSDESMPVLVLPSNLTTTQNVRTSLRPSNVRQKEFDEKSLKVDQLSLNPVNPGSFSDHMRSSVVNKNQTTALSPEAKRKSEKMDGSNTKLSSDLMSVRSADVQPEFSDGASARRFTHHQADLMSPEFGFKAPESFAASPRPPSPSFSPLLLQPCSKSQIGASDQTANEDAPQGGRLQAGTSSRWCLEKPRRQSGVPHGDPPSGPAAASVTFQATESTFSTNQNVHFPGARGSEGQRFTGKEAKLKGTTEEEQNSRTPDRASPECEEQNHRQNPDSHRYKHKH